MTALLIALSLLSLPAAAVGVMLLVAAKRARAAAPTLREGRSMAAPEGGWPRLCVVTPAHNEEENIATMARSLLGQDYPGLRLVFALDRCTDGTERVLREVAGDVRRVEIVKIERCPEEWAGKTHAVWRGVQDSEGAKDAELLLFTDADTEHGPGCLRAAVAILSARRLGMLSVLSTLRHERWYERVVQPICSMELMRHHPLPRVNREDEARAFANGQFMLFRRGAYEAIGGHGHEKVRGALLEDVALARRVAKSGERAGLVVSDGVLRCAMYGSFGAFARGWKRIFMESADRRPGALLAWAAVTIVGAGVLPASALAAWLVGMWARTVGGAGVAAYAAEGAGAIALALLVAGGMAAYRPQRAPLSAVALAPVGAVVTAWILWSAARDLRRGKGTAWGGRVYQRVAR